MGSTDFQKSIDDENNENDSGEDSQIDHGETSFYLIIILDQNIPVLIFPWITPMEERAFSDAWIPWAGPDASFVESQGIPVQDTISVVVL